MTSRYWACWFPKIPGTALSKKDQWKYLLSFLETRSPFPQHLNWSDALEHIIFYPKEGGESKKKQRRLSAKGHVGVQGWEGKRLAQRGPPSHDGDDMYWLDVHNSTRPSQQIALRGLKICDTYVKIFRALSRNEAFCELAQSNKNLSTSGHVMLPSPSARTFCKILKTMRIQIHTTLQWRINCRVSWEEGWNPVQVEILDSQTEHGSGEFGCAVTDFLSDEQVLLFLDTRQHLFFYFCLKKKSCISWLEFVLFLKATLEIVLLAWDIPFWGGGFERMSKPSKHVSGHCFDATQVEIHDGWDTHFRLFCVWNLQALAGNFRFSELLGSYNGCCKPSQTFLFRFKPMDSPLTFASSGNCGHSSSKVGVV